MSYIERFYSVPNTRRQAVVRKALSKFDDFQAGAKFDYFYIYDFPLKNKRPNRILLHIGANSTPSCTPEKIADQILGLKTLCCRNFNLWDYYFYSNAKDIYIKKTANKWKKLLVNNLKKWNIKLILNENF